ncbi:hypothetical protein RFI_37001, partial [Reticulomyxa filosa]
VILDDNVNIDGNVYAINCKIECRENVKISMQFFISKGTIINYKSQKCIFPIEWNTKIHHDIPIKLFDLNNKANYYLLKKKFTKAIVYLQKVIQIANDTFDIEHLYVAALNDSLGVIYLKIGQYDKSIEYCEIALKVRLTIFGTSHIDITISFYNLGFANFMI